MGQRTEFPLEILSIDHAVRLAATRTRVNQQAIWLQGELMPPNSAQFLGLKQEFHESGKVEVWACFRRSETPINGLRYAVADRDGTVREHFSPDHPFEWLTDEDLILLGATAYEQSWRDRPPLL